MFGEVNGEQGINPISARPLPPGIGIKETRKRIINCRRRRRKIRLPMLTPKPIRTAGAMEKIINQYIMVRRITPANGNGRRRKTVVRQVWNSFSSAITRWQ